MSRASSARPVLRLVAFGASNLTPELGTLAAAVRAAAGGPVDVLAACGHGRSYGVWSRYLAVRALPGIRDCALWRALDERPPLPTIALLMDVGNDVAYGVPPELINQWIDHCLRRLLAVPARVAVVLPPAARIEALAGWQFQIAKWLLFPLRNLDAETVKRRLRSVHDHLRTRAKEAGVDPIVVEPSWLGVDPIHFHTRGRSALRSALLDRWQLPDADPSPGKTTPLTLRGAQAAETRWLGWARHVRQPVRILPDGTSISLF